MYVFILPLFVCTLKNKKFPSLSQKLLLIILHLWNAVYRTLHFLWALSNVFWQLFGCWDEHRCVNPWIQTHFSKRKPTFLCWHVPSADHSLPYIYSSLLDGIFVDAATNTGWSNSAFFQLLNCCGVFDNGCTVSRCISLHILSILLSYIMLHLWILQWIQIVEEFAFFFATKASLYFFFSLGLLVSCNAWAHHSSSYKYSADAVLIFGAVSISEQPLIFWISENKYLISFCKHFKLFILCGFFLPPTSIFASFSFLVK